MNNEEEGGEKTNLSSLGLDVRQPVGPRPLGGGSRHFLGLLRGRGGGRPRPTVARRPSARQGDLSLIPRFDVEHRGCLSGSFWAASRTFIAASE